MYDETLLRHCADLAFGGLQDTRHRPSYANQNGQPPGQRRARALALSTQSWNNTLADWNRLEEVVTQLGASAPKAAKDALTSWQRSMCKLPNPFG